jgi:hypothetical protein
MIARQRWSEADALNCRVVIGPRRSEPRTADGSAAQQWKPDHAAKTRAAAEAVGPALRAVDVPYEGPEVAEFLARERAMFKEP